MVYTYACLFNAILAANHPIAAVEAVKATRKEFAQTEQRLSIEINKLQKDYKNNIEALKALREERNEAQKQVKAYTIVIKFVDGETYRFDVPDEIEGLVRAAVHRLDFYDALV